MSSAETSTKTTEKKKKIFASEVKACGNCGGAEGSAGVAKLSVCARCGLVVYCSKVCQRSDWKDSHKSAALPRRNGCRSPGLR